MEADDLAAGVIQTVSITDPDAQFIVVSADKDLIQLLRHDNVRLIDPATGNDRTLDDWNHDADLFMFEKCIRGDGGDNVQSARPRIRKTRIWKAYEDDFERANLMEETWTNQDGKEFKVKDLYKENILLMDLEEQPEDIQLRMIQTVIDGLENPGEYSFFHFMRFVGKYELKRISEQIENFTPMFSC